jgi:MFS family permease
MTVRSKGSRRTLVLLCLASACWAFGFGLGAPLASLWLRDAGCSARLIGLNTSIYYFGIAVSSGVVPWLLRRAGRACTAAGILVDALTTALFPWADLGGWFALRLAGGAATALSIIPMETLISRNAPPQRRARDFGLYAFSVALGVALGSLVGLPLYPLAPRLAFALGGTITLAAAVLAWFGWPREELATEEAPGDEALSLPANFLSFGTAWAQGFLEGGLITFLSIYLLSLDYTEGAVSILVGGLFLGVISCQVPLAWLADRLGRLRMLLACHAVLAAGLLCLPLCQGPVGLAGWLFLIGACCGALYPLGLALLSERVCPAALARANAWYLASNCAGSLSGPVLLGVVIDLLGRPAQFPAASLALLAVVGAWSALSLRRNRRPATAVKTSPRQTNLVDEVSYLPFRKNRVGAP